MENDAIGTEVVVEEEGEGTDTVYSDDRPDISSGSNSDSVYESYSEPYSESSSE